MSIRPHRMSKNLKTGVMDKKMIRPSTKSVSRSFVASSAPIILSCHNILQILKCRLVEMS